MGGRVRLCGRPGNPPGQAWDPLRPDCTHAPAVFWYSVSLNMMTALMCLPRPGAVMYSSRYAWRVSCVGVAPRGVR